MNIDRKFVARFWDCGDQVLCIIQTQEKEIQIFTTPAGEAVTIKCDAWGWRAIHTRKALLDLYDIIRTEKKNNPQKGNTGNSIMNNEVWEDDRWWRLSIEWPVDVYISATPAKRANTVNFKKTYTTENIYNALVQLSDAIEKDNQENPE